MSDKQEFTKPGYDRIKVKHTWEAAIVIINWPLNYEINKELEDIMWKLKKLVSTCIFDLRLVPFKDAFTNKVFDTNIWILTEAGCYVRIVGVCELTASLLRQCTSCNNVDYIDYTELSESDIAIIAQKELESEENRKKVDQHEQRALGKWKNTQEGLMARNLKRATAIQEKKKYKKAKKAVWNKDGLKKSYNHRSWWNKSNNTWNNPYKSNYRKPRIKY